MGHWSLSAPVGIGQPNTRRDVRTVQKLLNRSRNDDPRSVPLPIKIITALSSCKKFDLQHLRVFDNDAVSIGNFV